MELVAADRLVSADLSSQTLKTLRRRLSGHFPKFLFFFHVFWFCPCQTCHGCFLRFLVPHPATSLQGRDFSFSFRSSNQPVSAEVEGSGGDSPNICPWFTHSIGAAVNVNSFSPLPPTAVHTHSVGYSKWNDTHLSCNHSPAFLTLDRRTRCCKRKTSACMGGARVSMVHEVVGALLAA